ncbi:phosphoribosylanthranilate isomerase [Flammeovirga sp. SubArs3]|uniref:phosphoribosylanthranilate isomerase n=1 Tax=Flammeovirga sp. SubArs3 TaxID=2995316 RepID=UPI00248BBE75|nr:phosphoribosylanthranilate isomerase [Flammeovirga sp. SubArs3]
MNKNKQNIETVSWKVCGMRDQKNIYDVLTLAPDYMGFIIYPPSSRFIEKQDVSFLEEKWPDTVKTKRVGVFVNEDESTILAYAKKYHFDVIQLHGTEPPSLCESLKTKGFEVFKVFGIKDEFNFEALKPYEAYVDYFLFDTKSPQHGGTGETFDWGVLEQYSSTKPFLLSGGLSLENIKNIRKLDHLPCKGIDVNSKFETSPAFKDIEQLKSLAEWVKSINNKK